MYGSMLSYLMRISEDGLPVKDGGTKDYSRTLWDEVMVLRPVTLLLVRGLGLESPAS